MPRTLLVTNGARIELGDEAGQLRQYKVIYEHEGHYMVQAMNGYYKGEYLIFPNGCIGSTRC